MNATVAPGLGLAGGVLVGVGVCDGVGIGVLVGTGEWVGTGVGDDVGAAGEGVGRAVGVAPRIGVAVGLGGVAIAVALGAGVTGPMNAALGLGDGVGTVGARGESDGGALGVALGDALAEFDAAGTADAGAAVLGEGVGVSGAVVFIEDAPGAPCATGGADPPPEQPTDAALSAIEMAKIRREKRIRGSPQGG